jgi:transitional endoplasmic reticulum ATPase
MSSPDPLSALREAVAVSPENVPLRLHLAEQLLGHGRPAEAEREFRAALALAPDDAKLKVGLATSFYQQGKNSEAMVLAEALVKQPSPPPRARVLFCRLLLKAGDVDNAVRQYKKAIEADPSLEDLELGSRLGVSREETSADDDRREVVDGKVRAAFDGSGGDFEIDVERPKVTFKDVGGMEALKDEIRMKIIHPLTHADLYKAYGKQIGGGILLYGPPGCGKTHLARATAGEIKAGFVSIGINDVLDMWIGNSEKNLHELFDQARRNRPCTAALAFVLPRLDDRLARQLLSVATTAFGIFTWGVLIVAIGSNWLAEVKPKR